MIGDSTKNNIFIYLLALTGLFLLAEITFVVHFNGFYLADVRLVSDRLTIPSSVWPAIIFFSCVQLMLHFLFTVLVWGMARLSSVALQLSWQQTEKLGFVMWVMSMMGLVLANQYFFPNSSFVMITGNFLSQTATSILLIPILIFMTFAVSLSVVGLWRSINHGVIAGVIAGLSGLFFFAYYFQPSALPMKDAATDTKPNIIVVGIDALRPDFLGYFGHTPATPHLDHFLNGATVFSMSVTPLARTFPSWISLLTGQYPKRNSIRTDLSDTSQFDFATLLPVILRHQGYQTLYAIDDTRFSNIDQQFGFDRVVMPPIGFNNFLLGSFNDFPLSNLLINTSLGKQIFPYNYANRASYVTYQPHSFIQLLDAQLKKSRDKPLFLAVHFCLPHLPYLWASQPAGDNYQYNYQAAVLGADQQFADFMEILKKDQVLNHAMLVLLSDHGEALELSGDRVTHPELFVPGGAIPKFYPASHDTEAVDQSAGHGTDVLGLSQYHTVLAFHAFGLPPNQQRTVTQVVSLVDVKPSLLALLKLPRTQPEDGISLLPLIEGNQAFSLTRRDIFMESDFSPEAIKTIHPDMRHVLFTGIDYFHIDPVTTRVLVKKDMLDLIYASKQYADIYDHWMLALYPQANQQMIPILVDLNTGLWTNHLTTSFARHSPAAHMLQAMQLFFGTDIGRVINS